MATRKNIKRGVRKEKESEDIVRPFRQKTPKDRAAFDLYTTLTKDYGVSSREAEAMSRELMRIDTFTTMNIPVLAASLLLLERHPVLTQEVFTSEDFKRYLDQLMRNVTPPDGKDPDLVREYNKIRYGYMESILRYISKIIVTRNEMSAKYQEELAAERGEEEEEEERTIEVEIPTFVDVDEV